MDKPTIADKSPMRVELEAGKKYAWCSCGNSSNQPFCDGAHKGGSFTPVVFEVEESRTYSMCMCKHSERPQFCDGKHKGL